MYDENKLSEKRKSIGGGEKNFELYSSIKDKEQKKWEKIWFKYFIILLFIKIKLICDFI